ENLRDVRLAIEAAVPHGRTHNGQPTADKGSWRDAPTPRVTAAWDTLRDRYARIAAKHPTIARGPEMQHLGTLGTGNHFIEMCIAEGDSVWFMLPSGSRGVGNRIGQYFIERAKDDMRRHFIHLPDQDLSYLVDGSENFVDYVDALGWAQDYAAL